MAHAGRQGLASAGTSLSQREHESKKAGKYGLLTGVAEGLLACGNEVVRHLSRILRPSAGLSAHEGGGVDGLAVSIGVKIFTALLTLVRRSLLCFFFGIS